MLLDSIEIGKFKTEQLLSIYGHFWPDLYRVKAGDSRSSQVLTEAIEGTDYFTNIVSKSST